MLDIFNKLAVVNTEDGQGMVEYALILALVSIVAIATLLLMGAQIAALFQTVVTGLAQAS